MSRNQSIVRFPRLDGMPDQRYDVVIMGGGLAGLTLALQLKKTRPETSIMVAEKRAGPAPLSAFKVGESTLELSTYYFAEVVGMRDHLEQAQAPKSGLRFFFPANGNEDVSARLEWGPTRFPLPDSFQLDRGLFENELMRRNVLNGIDAFDGCRVHAVEIGEGEAEHRVTVSREDELGAQAEATVACRWLVDATGRAFTLKKKLGLLKDCDHNVNASWLRLAGGIDIDDFSEDPNWRARIEEPKVRMLSTNHLCGEGYWVWLIPLSSGSISIGIVADPRFHPYERISTLDGALEWFGEHEPQLFAALDARRDDVEDFLKVEHFAYSAERVYSPDRWCLTGEAGTFLDPLYSPGSDYIAMSNTFITDLIGGDLGGADVTNRIEAWNHQYLELAYGTFLLLYLDQYAHFGNPQVMIPKLVWEFSTYWGVVALRFVNDKLTDLPFTQTIWPALQVSLQMNEAMEPLFRRWHDLSPPEPASGFLSTSTMPGVVELQSALASPVGDDEGLKAMMVSNIEFLKALAVLIFHQAVKSLPEDERPPEDARINPTAVSLEPGRWEVDGLLDESGVSLVEARERAPGIEQVLSLETAAVA